MPYIIHKHFVPSTLIIAAQKRLSEMWCQQTSQYMGNAAMLAIYYDCYLFS